MRNFALFLVILIYSCSEKSASDKTHKNQFYDEAFAYREKGKIDSSFLYFNKARDLFLKSKDSFGAGKCLVNMAIIQTDKNDYFGGQETSLQAIKYFKKNIVEHNHYIGTNFNNLGIASHNLKDYNNSLEFYNKAIFHSDNLVDTNVYLNNKALTLQKAHKYNEAVAIYSEILEKNKKGGIEFSRALSNLAKTKWLQNPNYNPIPELTKALNIRLKENDKWGLNASYSHLTDYYIKTRLDSALFYGKKMYETAKEIKSPDDQIEALQKLISIENADNSRQYFKIYQKLNDSLQTARSKAKNQFALIRYETEKNKADFLKAKAESTQRQNYIIKQYIIIFIIISVLIALIIWFKKRQKRLEQEKLLEVKNTELRYSKKVHDRVANRIYQIMSQVENTEQMDRNALLFGLENVYETSRDISYENKEINENQNFSDQISNLLDSYTSDKVKIIFNGNNEKLWDGINFQTKTETYLILQELMTNMKKHSQADKVFLKFIKTKTDVNISYTDNGIGMRDQLPKNGLQNMENRIHAINGKINFDTETKTLLKINMTFPI